MRKDRDKSWFVIFVGGQAICPPVLGLAASWDIAREHPGAIRRCYATLREALKAMERGPDYPGDSAPPLFEW
jgi:hypothetical protein